MQVYFSNLYSEIRMELNELMTCGERSQMNLGHKSYVLFTISGSSKLTGLTATFANWAQTIKRHSGIGAIRTIRTAISADGLQ